MLAVSARARGEKQHGFGAGRPHSWRLRLDFSPNEAWRAWQRSRFGSAFEREASGRDTTLGEQKLAGAVRSFSNRIPKSLSLKLAPLLQECLSVCCHKKWLTVGPKNLS